MRQTSLCRNKIADWVCKMGCPGNRVGISKPYAFICIPYVIKEHCTLRKYMCFGLSFPITYHYKILALGNQMDYRSVIWVFKVQSAEIHLCKSVCQSTQSWCAHHQCLFFSLEVALFSPLCEFIADKLCHSFRNWTPIFIHRRTWW